MSSSTIAFSNDGVEVISRQLNTDLTLTESRKSDKQVEESYELQRCIDFINSNDFFRVALQFPDNALCHSTDIALRLRESTQQEIFIMADTSYGRYSAI